jgi:hypothetical protein
MNWRIAGMRFVAQKCLKVIWDQMKPLIIWKVFLSSFENKNNLMKSSSYLYRRSPRDWNPRVVSGFEPLNSNFTHFWTYRTAKAFTFSLESNLNIDKNRSTLSVGSFTEICAPTGIRTPVVALKGLRPSPLDDGGRLLLERADFIIPSYNGQAFYLFFFFRALTQQG